MHSDPSTLPPSLNHYLFRESKGTVALEKKARREKMGMREKTCQRRRPGG
jgi:hypothetical protein